ncbi:hypothetical protein DLZ06_22010 [Escherichia coli]|nr:hypothetical protein [Escherichia coli]
MSLLLTLAINCESNNKNIIIGERYKQNKAVKEYVNVIKQLNIAPETLIEHLSDLNGKLFLDIYKYYLY